MRTVMTVLFAAAFAVGGLTGCKSSTDREQAQETQSAGKVIEQTPQQAEQGMTDLEATEDLEATAAEEQAAADFEAQEDMEAQDLEDQEDIEAQEDIEVEDVDDPDLGTEDIEVEEEVVDPLDEPVE